MELVGHHTWDPLQRSEPLLVPGGIIGCEQDVAHVSVPSQNRGGPVGECLAKGCSRLQALALAAAEAGGCTGADAFDGRFSLN